MISPLMLDKSSQIQSQTALQTKFIMSLLPAYVIPKAVSSSKKKYFLHDTPPLFVLFDIIIQEKMVVDGWILNSFLEKYR